MRCIAIYVYLLLVINSTVCAEIIPGLYYKHLTLNKPLCSIHILVANPSKINIRIGVAHNNCTSAQKTSEIAKDNNAIAAINGGFFDFGCKNATQQKVIQFLDRIGYSHYKAFPMWTLNKDQHYYSIGPHLYTGAVGWNTDEQRAYFGAIKTTCSLDVAGKKLPVHDLNKPHPKGPTLYSAQYGRKTPLFDEKVHEVIIQDNKVIKMYHASRGKKKIPVNGWVYVLPDAYKQQARQLHVGDSVDITIATQQKPDLPSSIDDAVWTSLDNILAGTPLLIKDNKFPDYLKRYSTPFYTHRYPRSAVGILKNSKWVFVIIDGRQKHSEGLTALELAHVMKQLGCTNALNLDGGGSTTMVIHNKVINSPSGLEHSLIKKERPVSNVILLSEKLN